MKKWGLVCFGRKVNCQNFTHFSMMGKVGKDFEADYKYKEGKTNDNKKAGVRPSRKNKRKE